MDVVDGVDGSLQAQTHIWNYLFNFINSMSLKCAVQLRIPEAILKHGNQPVSLSQLVSELRIPNAKAAFVRRLMRVLNHSGFFTMQRIGDTDGEDAYLLTDSSKLLLRENPHSLAPFILAMLDPWLLTPWQSLSAWFLVDSPTPFHLLHGASFWEQTSLSPEMNTLFNEAMASDSRLTMDAALREHGQIFQALKSLVDVGGGNGTTAMVIVKAFPQLKCTVLELPHVVASAPQDTAVEFVAGDMFEYIPRADAVLLKWILHDWSDDDCVKLLKRCKEAIPPKEGGGKVIIVDMVMSDDLRHELKETQLFFDMMMTVLNHGGKERNQQELQKLFTDAGFTGYKIAPGLGLRAIIELYY